MQDSQTSWQGCRQQNISRLWEVVSMKCRLCKTQMLVDRVVEKEEDSVAEVHYKCPNKNCANFGYAEKEKEGE